MLAILLSTKLKAEHINKYWTRTIVAEQKTCFIEFFEFFISRWFKRFRLLSFFF